MKKLFFLIAYSFSQIVLNAQGATVTSWLRNNTVKGSYYTFGNSTAVTNNILVNCQKVEYSATSVFVTTKGIPSYPTGPFLDGNPSQATDQNAIFKFPLNPTVNSGTKTATSGGNIGVFINGVALFDYRDGVAWNNTTGALCGGPGNPACPGGMGAAQAWNRDAILAEKAGFDCSKGHPAMGNYHHHQNPSAFKLDKTVISNICNLYDADGLYVIDETKHSPLIGFAYDGFPIYGAYASKNVDGTGGIVRMKSSYKLNTNTTRLNGPTVGQVVGTQTMINGYFREDYLYTATSASTPDYLDEHNGRFCKTPEYPAGIYCYFATVDANHNSAYPYAVGPTFYGVYVNRKVTSVTETTTEYTGSIGGSSILVGGNAPKISIFPNPSSEFIAVQIGGLVTEDLSVRLISMDGRELAKTEINKGQTNGYIDVRSLYNGVYFMKISDGLNEHAQKIEIQR